MLVVGGAASLEASTAPPWRGLSISLKGFLRRRTSSFLALGAATVALDVARTQAEGLGDLEANLAGRFTFSCGGDSENVKRYSRGNEKAYHRSFVPSWLGPSVPTPRWHRNGVVVNFTSDKLQYAFRMTPALHVMDNYPRTYRIRPNPAALRCCSLNTRCGATHRAIPGFDITLRFSRVPEDFNGAQANFRMISRSQPRHTSCQ